MSKKSKRKIVVDGVEYTWQYGSTCIPIRRNGAIVAKPQVTEVTGQSWDEIERGTHKGYFHLTPKDIAEYIKKNVDTFVNI